VPQGGPLSPLLANLLLDDLDRELEKRGEDAPHAGGELSQSAVGAEKDPARLVVVLRLQRGADAASRVGEVDSSAPAVLSLEAVG
jgi:hypothetical protein